MRFLERNQHDGPTLSNVDEEGNYRMSLELESSSVASQNDTPPLQSSAPKRGRRDSDELMATHEGGPVSAQVPQTDTPSPRMKGKNRIGSRDEVQATIERIDEHLQRSRHQQHPTVDSFQGFGDFVAQHLRERFDAYTADVKMRQMLEVLFSYTYCSQGNEGVVHEEYVGEYPENRLKSEFLQEKPKMTGLASLSKCIVSIVPILIVLFCASSFLRPHFSRCFIMSQASNCTVLHFFPGLI
ncbi:hypothetical protein OSTOST_23892, partial [Ostertagia ostertagi]